MIDQSDPRHAALLWACRAAQAALLAACGKGDSPAHEAAGADMRHFWSLMGEAQRAAARRLGAALDTFGEELGGRADDG